MNNNLMETAPLQAVSAKVHWRIKKLLLEAADKASLTLSEYLNMLINQVLQDNAESAKLQSELELLKQKLMTEEAKSAALKKSDEAKSLRQKEVEVLLERNDQILGTLHQRYGDNPISKDLNCEGPKDPLHFPSFQNSWLNTIFSLHPAQRLFLLNAF